METTSPLSKSDFKAEFEKLPSEAQACCVELVKAQIKEERSLHHAKSEAFKEAVEIFSNHFVPRWPEPQLIQWIHELYLTKPKKDGNAVCMEQDDYCSTDYTKE